MSLAHNLVEIARPPPPSSHLVWTHVDENRLAAAAAQSKKDVIATKLLGLLGDAVYVEHAIQVVVFV
jgi:hypothetical protein